MYPALSPSFSSDFPRHFWSSSEIGYTSRSFVLFFYRLTFFLFSLCVVDIQRGVILWDCCTTQLEPGLGFTLLFSSHRKKKLLKRQHPRGFDLCEISSYRANPFMYRPQVYKHAAATHTHGLAFWQRMFAVGNITHTHVHTHGHIFCPSCFRRKSRERNIRIYMRGLDKRATRWFDYCSSRYLYRPSAIWSKLVHCEVDYAYSHMSPVLVCIHGMTVLYTCSMYISI
jgi:hypothetical protein